MKIESRRPINPFDFNEAVGAVFKTADGKDYALRLWVWHSLAIFIVLIISLPLLVPYLGEYLEQAWEFNQQAFSGDPADVQGFMGVLVKMIPGYTVMLIGLLIAASIGEAAFYRKYLLGAEPAKVPLRFDRHLLRNAIIQLGFYSLYTVVYIGGALAIGLIGGFGTVINPVIGGILFVVGFIALFVGLIAYPIKFAPSSALSHFDDKAHILATRKVTKFRFWPLFGAYLVTYIGGYIAYYIIYIMIAIMITGDPNFMLTMSGLSSESPRIAFEAAGARLSNPLIMIMTVLGIAAISAAWSAWMLWIAGVSAYAVKWWASDDPTLAFE